MPITNTQLKHIYALAGGLGLVDRGDPCDPLHQVVSGSYGQEHVSDLSESEANSLLAWLRDAMRGVKEDAKAKSKPASVPAAMTEGQQKKCWALMYELERIDPRNKSVGERLCALTKAYLHIDTVPKNPFGWLTYQQGRKLIEVIKGVVETERRRRDGGLSRPGEA